MTCLCKERCNYKCVQVCMHIHYYFNIGSNDYHVSSIHEVILKGHGFSDRAFFCQYCMGTFNLESIVYDPGAFDIATSTAWYLLKDLCAQCFEDAIDPQDFRFIFK